MKKIIYTILCCLVFGISYAAVVKYQEVAVGSIVKAQEVAIGSVVDIEEVDTGCTLAYFSDVAEIDSDTPIAEDGDDDYVGQQYIAPANQCVCAVDVYVNSVDGTLTADHDFYMQIFTLASDNITALVTNGTSAKITGESIAITSWLSENAGRFEFSPAVALTSGEDYALAITMDNDDDGPAPAEPDYDGTNFFNWGRDNSGDGGDTVADGVGRWAWQSGAVTYASSWHDGTDIYQIKVYTETCP